MVENKCRAEESNKVYLTELALEIAREQESGEFIWV
jgi:hypothetical protein